MIHQRSGSWMSERGGVVVNVVVVFSTWEHRPPTDPSGSTPEQLKATQQPEVRDATVGIVENLMDIRTKAAKATSHYYLCSPLTHYCQVRGRHGGLQRGVGGCC